MAKASAVWAAGIGPGFAIMRTALKHNNSHHIGKTGVHVEHSSQPSSTNPMSSVHTVTFHHPDQTVANRAKKEFSDEVTNHINRITGRF